MKFFQKLKTRGLYGALFERIALSKLNFRFLSLIVLLFQLLFLAFFSLGWSIFKQTTVRNQIDQVEGVMLHTRVMTGVEFFQLGEASYELKALTEGLLAEGKTRAEIIAELNDRFLFLARTRSFYDQVRLYDAAGVEIVRVENRASRQTQINPEALEDKSSRPYFEKAFQLGPDEFIYHGPTVMTENGQVLMPPRAVIQTFFPVQNPTTGEIFGYVNINYDVDQLFGEIRETLHMIPGSVNIIGPDGEWFYSKKPKGDFENYLARGLNFKNQSPELWNLMQQQHEAQITSGTKPIIYKKVDVYPGLASPHIPPIELSVDLSAQRFIEGFYLLVVVEPPSLETLFEEAPFTVYAVWGGFFVFTLILSFYITYLVAIRASMKERTRHSLKMEAVGELTGGVAHDFNNLLTAIIGNLGLLERGKNSKAEKEMIQQSLKAAWRGADLTKRLLAFSRKSHLDPRRLNLCTVLKEIEPLVRTTVGEHVKFKMEVPDEELSVSIDPLEYENVVLNLAINARDAMKEGGSLTISAYHDSFNKEEATAMEIPPGDYIVTNITDSGEGMPLAVQKQAIDPFFTTKPIGEGSGLGLSMAYGFAKQSHGDLKIISEVGKGTTILVFLPEAAEEPPEEEVKE